MNRSTAIAVSSAAGALMLGLVVSPAATATDSPPIAPTPIASPSTTTMPAARDSSTASAGRSPADASLAATPRAKKARWMGPALNRLPANNTFTCREQPQPLFPIPSYVNTCTWIGIGTMAGNALDGYLIPRGGGTVTTVQIKVGPVTGRMQLVVVRAMRKDKELNSACCFYRARSKVFTPRPNSIHSVRVNFRMEHSMNKTTKIWNFDSLGLSVLDGGVPMPAYVTGSAGGYNDPGVAGFYPHIGGDRESRADGIGISGYQMLMRAQYIPN